MKFPVYLDNNATTPCDPRVLEHMLPYFTNIFGNAASRTHAYGWQAEEAVEMAREQVAALIGSETKEIVFTSGATEADNLAIKGVFEMYAPKGNHLITVSTEHKAVLDACKHVEKNGGEISYLPVRPDGLINLDELESLIRPTTILIAVMYANNETGVIQPINEISKIARNHHVLFFTDAAQGVGKVPIDVNKSGIDLMALSAHKNYGPKGVGALYVRRKSPKAKLIPQMDGGGHERGMRSGTLNVAGIVGLGKACELSMQEMETENRRLAVLRDKLEQGLLKLDQCYVNGSLEHRLPHVTNLSFKHVDANALMTGFSKDIAVSSGSACSSASIEPSYVLKAMGLDDVLAHSSLRFALGRYTTEEEIDFAIDRVGSTVSQLRNNSMPWEKYKQELIGPAVH
jgi:cysteine desulfurase